MKKFLFVLLFILVCALGAGWYKRDTLIGWLSMTRTRSDTRAADVTGQTARNGKRVLIAYYSWGGNTRDLAVLLREKIGGDLFAIRPVDDYPTDYRATVERGKAEKDSDARPALVGPLPDMSNYDIVLLGYPIWWWIEPMVIDTFVTSVDLNGKTVLLFATSGGSTIEASVEHLRALLPGVTVGDGCLMNMSSRIEPWLAENQLIAR